MLKQNFYLFCCGICLILTQSSCLSKGSVYYSDAEIEEAFQSGAAVTELGTDLPDHIGGRFRTLELEYEFYARHAGDRVDVVLRKADRDILVASWTQNLVDMTIFGERLRIPVNTNRTLLGVDTNGVSHPLINRFARTDIYHSLPNLSRSLAMLGVTGTSHPASLVLHRIALASETISDNSSTTKPPNQGSERVPMMYANPQYASRVPKIAIFDFGLVDRIYGCDELALAGPFLIPERYEAISEMCNLGGGECQNLEDDPNDDECDGMCGAGCSCWKWVCGDCCAYAGCQVHDDLTRDCLENGFLGTELASCPLAGLFFPVIPLTNILACGFSF